MQVTLRKAVGTAAKSQAAEHWELETVAKSLRTWLHAAGALGSGMTAVLPQAVACNLKEKKLPSKKRHV